MVADDAGQKWKRRLSVAAWVSLVVHFVAGLCMAFILSNALATNPEINSRLTFLTEQRTLWVIGWVPWNVAAICILCFLYCFSEAYKKEVKSPAFLKFSVIVAAFSVLCDLNAQTMAMVYLPQLAEQSLNNPDLLPLFHNLYNSIIFTTGTLGNAGYTIATVLTAWLTRAYFPKWVTAVALVIGVVGTTASVACLLNSLWLQVAANGSLIPLLSLWFVGVGFTARRQAATAVV